MSIGSFTNETGSLCTAPLLDESLFPKKGGYQAGRYCGLGAFEVGASQVSCCFPCPIEDWVYPPDWQSHLRIPNYLSILSLVLCVFLLFSFLVLPPAQSHRHYLSIGLLIPVLLISLSFSIPVSTKPNYCYDAITPADMYSSMSCAWTGSLVTLGGLGCVIWVFLRSLWLFVRIIYDVAPGRRFMYGSIATGTLLPVVFLVAVLTSTGYSYRMGQTCLPNHENAIVTFWVWLVVFAILGFILQSITTGYCVWIFIRTLRRERSNRSSEGHGQTRRTSLETWMNVKKLFVLQWRNILVSVFVLTGSLVFFIVFWTQDSKLGLVFNDPANIKPVKIWIICELLSGGEKEECRKYVKNFTIGEPAVLTSLILASLIGIEIFILLFRRSMAQAWIALFKRSGERMGWGWGRPPTPELTSFDNPEKYSLPSPNDRLQGSRFVESFDADQTSVGSPVPNGSGKQTTPPASPPPPPPRSPPPPPGSPPPPCPPVPPPEKIARPCQPLLPDSSSESFGNFQSQAPKIHITTPSTLSLHSLSLVETPQSLYPPRLLRPLSSHSPAASTTHRYHPSRPAPLPPSRRSESSRPSTPTSVISSWSGRSLGTQNTQRSWRDSTISALDRVVVTNEADSGDIDGEEDQRSFLKSGLRISGPVLGSFRHVDGAFIDRAGDAHVRVDEES